MHLNRMVLQYNKLRLLLNFFNVTEVCLHVENWGHYI